MLAQPAQVLAMALQCLSVSVRHIKVGVLSKGMNGLIWFLTRGLLSTSFTLCFKKIQVSTKITVHLNFLANSGLGKFRHGISIVERAINLARERWTLSERDKLDRHWSTKLAISQSSHARQL